MRRSFQLAAGGLAALLLALAAPVLTATGALAAFTVPYNDPSANGTIGLCDRNGHSITSGNLADNPFAWTAVSSVPVAQGFGGTEHKAVLAAYLPIQGVPPGYWSGKYLTASSQYTNLKHPMAQGTIADGPLKWFVGAYPPHWDGLVQLRMFLSAYNTGVYNTTYPTTDIRVTGNTWTVVRGGTGSCSVGRAVSVETLRLSTSQIDRIAGVTPSPTATGTSTAQASASSNASTGSDPAQASGPGTRSTASRDSSKSTVIILIGLLAVAALGVGVGGAAIWQSRRSRGAP